MAIKVDAKIIEQINELYYQLHNKAAVARQIGCSPATVSRYINPDYVPYNRNNEIKFDINLLNIEGGIARFRGVNNYGSLCIMSTEEFKEIQELWKEIR